MSLYLKSPSDIQAIIDGSTYAAIDVDTKTKIALHFEEMPASVREATLDVLVGSLPSIQAAFAQALFSTTPTSGGGTITPPPSGNSGGSGGDNFVADIPALRAVVTLGVATGSMVRGATFIPAGSTDNVIGLWRTRAGTDTDNPPAIVRPNDFNASTNPQVWEKEL